MSGLATRHWHDRLAAAPISWGVCEVPDWGAQLSVDRVLSEMVELGFTQTELGAEGWLPTEPAELAAALEGHGLALLGAFIPIVGHDEAEVDANEAQIQRSIELLAATGATYFITSPVMTWDWGPRRPLTDAEWDRLYRTLDDIEQRCQRAGLAQAIHPHLHTVLERADDVQRVLDHTDAGFTLDTGHLAIGGYDPLEFVANHADRIRHVHLKDVVMNLAMPVLDGERSIMEGVQAGMFCNLGAGDIPIAAAISAVEDAGFDGWYVIEQDAAISGAMPAVGAGPMVDVAASVSYLRELS